MSRRTRRRRTSLSSSLATLVVAGGHRRFLGLGGPFGGAAALHRDVPWTTTKRSRDIAALSLARGGEIRSFNQADFAAAEPAATPQTQTQWPRGATREDEVEEDEEVEAEARGEELEEEKSNVSRDELLRMVEREARGLDERFVEPKIVVDKALSGLSQRADLTEAETLLAESAAYMASRHPDYSKLAGRVACASLRRRTRNASFGETLTALHEAHKTRWGAELLAPGLYRALTEDAEFRARVDAACAASDFERDLDYFGFKTLDRSYLLKEETPFLEEDDDTVVVVEGSKTLSQNRKEVLLKERPSQMLMRVALGIHEGWESEKNLSKALETFELLATRCLMHASPTLFHAGTKKPHLASCFLLGTAHDSIEGIYACLSKCASISKAAGGIGLSVSDVRAAGSRIRGTGGASNGLVPMLRVFDATARYVDQGGGKRPGAFAAYVEPWHADVFDVLELKKNHGKEERRARDLFYALWIPDIFMRRVRDDLDWSLCCPDECPGLTSTWGSEFEELYEKYEREGRAKRTVKARTLWKAILDAQIETGTPYMLYKDACNRKSNHQHLGTIRCSNLCCEIVEYSDANQVAVCNLASIVLTGCLSSVESTRDDDEEDNVFFDFEKLRRVAKVAAANLDATIDAAAYPCDDARRSNAMHRPVGLGVQGFADALAALNLPFDSEKARVFNRDVFETLYFAALEASCERAKLAGKPYDSYRGSPASRGLLQPDLWGVDPIATRPIHSNVNWDWAALRQDIAEHGLRNSLLVAPMPTASTAQIVGVNECFEPYTSNLYARRVQAGEFIVINKHLVNDLAKRGLWTEDVRQDILRHRGSVQRCDAVPDDVKNKYKTAWELKQKTLVDLAADRGPFVDQSQSLNAFIAQPDHKTLTAYHFYGWRRGLKTGMYYLRTKPAASALQFTLDPPEKEDRPASTTSAAAAAAAADDRHTDDPPDDTAHDGPVCLACSG